MSKKGEKVRECLLALQFDEFFFHFFQADLYGKRLPKGARSVQNKMSRSLQEEQRH